MEDNIVKDALGNPIVIGGYYGYHRYTNGVTHNMMGIALSVSSNTNKVKLDVLEGYKAIYSDEVKRRELTRNITTVKANSLFNVVT